MVRRRRDRRAKASIPLARSRRLPLKTMPIPFLLRSVGKRSSPSFAGRTLEEAVCKATILKSSVVFIFFGSKQFHLSVLSR